MPSRFLQRLAAVAGETWAPAGQRGARYLDLARALDRPARSRPIARPAPQPPVALRPTSLSVTRIEVLRRDPYSIYAERILEARAPRCASRAPWGRASSAPPSTS